MYNINVHGSQVHDLALLSISVSETDDTGVTQVLFTTTEANDSRNPALPSYSLERFLEQVVVGLSSALAVRWTPLDDQEL